MTIFTGYLELMAAKANEHPQADLILGCAMVMKVDMKDEAEWRYEVKAFTPCTLTEWACLPCARAVRYPFKALYSKKPVRGLRRPA